MNKWPGHPSDIYVSQDKLLPGILDFLAEHVFGPNRLALLAHDPDKLTDNAATAWHERIQAIERSLGDLDSRRTRLLDALETTDDPHGVLVQDVNRRLGEIVAAQHAKLVELQRLRAEPPSTTGQIA